MRTREIEAAKKRDKKLYLRACKEAEERGVYIGESIEPENSGYGWHLDDDRKVVWTFHEKPIPRKEAPAWLQLNYSGFLDYHGAYTVKKKRPQTRAKPAY